ncbi:unnamed protein product [Alopecurus aequalis]
MGWLDDCCTLTNQDRSKLFCIYLFVGLLVAGAITAVVLLPLRYAAKPHVEASIEDARLRSFAFSTTQTPNASFLAYNISVAISIHNPTWLYAKLTKPLVAAVAFHDNRLLNVSVAGKGHQYRPSKKEVHRLLESGEVPWDVLGATALEDFQGQNKTGVFNIEVRLSGELTYLGLDVIGNKRSLGFSCPLSLQLAPPGHGVVLFHDVTCKPEPENIYFV